MGSKESLKAEFWESLDADQITTYVELLVGSSRGLKKVVISQRRSLTL